MEGSFAGRGFALKPGDLVVLLGECHLHSLLALVRPAAAKWRKIGIALRFEKNVLDEIEATSRNLDPIACFTELIGRWLKRAPPKNKFPTLEELTEALRSDVVEEERIAYDLKKKWKEPIGLSSEAIPVLPQSVSSQELSSASATATISTSTRAKKHSRNGVKKKRPTASCRRLHIEQNIVTSVRSVEEVRAHIRGFEGLFRALKKSTREDLEKRCISVEEVVTCLTELPADDMPEHKVFFENHVFTLFKADGHNELFGAMNTYWNYLAYHLLDHLIQEFEIEEVKVDMKTYNLKLKQFRRETSLVTFCRTQKRRQIEPPPGFRKMVINFNWPDTVTLEAVEEFRQQYVCCYGLRECAMMLIAIEAGSFNVVWLIPKSIVEYLSTKETDIHVCSLIAQHNVANLEIDGILIYPVNMNPARKYMKFSEAFSYTSTVQHTATKKDDRYISAASTEAFNFVEPPPDDCLCHVTTNLLLQPHLTACCGNHLSHEAVTKIQGEGGHCPFCMEKTLTTILDKKFRRRVRELQVYCPQKESGCGWKGELLALEDHVPIHNAVTTLPPTDEAHAKTEAPIPTEKEANTKMTNQLHVESYYHSDQMLLDPNAIVWPTGVTLGAGAFGEVVEVEFKGQKYAAKSYFGREDMQQSLFEGRMDILTTIRHPNIVTYYGTCYFPNGEPVLVMQMMKYNLFRFILSPENASISLQSRLSLLLNVASGLNHLHSLQPEAIIHRDLTPTNVLLDSANVAKISDFGNSCVVNLSCTPYLMTSHPGTLNYMPPEALEGESYNDKLDVFSFGHLSLFVIIQRLPNPLLPYTYRKKGALIARSEVERRQVYIQEAESKLGEDHPFFRTFIRCLHDEAHMRPTMKEVLDLLTHCVNP